MLTQWLSYRRKWYWLWLFDALTVGAWAFFLYKNPSPFGKDGDASANTMLYMMLYGLLRAAWLFVLVFIFLIKQRWWMVVSATVHGGAWLMLSYLLSILFMGAVGGH